LGEVGAMLLIVVGVFVSLLSNYYL
jgi:hypothetical protein